MFEKLGRALWALVVTPVLVVAGLAFWAVFLGGCWYAAWLLLGLVPGMDRDVNKLFRFAASGPVGGVIVLICRLTFGAAWRALKDSGVDTQPLPNSNVPLPWEKR